jgi:hypothetical protein
MCNLQTASRWLSPSETDILDDGKLSSTYRWFWGHEDPFRAPLVDPLAVGKDKKIKAAVLGSAPEAPPLFGGIMKQVGASEAESSGALTSFMTAVQMRDRVVAERKATAAAVSSPSIADDELELAKAKRLLKILDDNKGKFPVDFNMEEWEAKTATELGGDTDTASKQPDALPAVVKSAIAGVFSFLRKAARETPTLCVEPLDVLNKLVASFQPQSMLGESADSVTSMMGFFSSLCTPEMAAAAALSADLPEASLVPASLSGLTSLAVARGNLSSMLSAVVTLLSHTGAKPANTVTLPIPTPLLTLAKVAKGATNATTIVPSAETLRNTTPVELPEGTMSVRCASAWSCRSCAVDPLVTVRDITLAVREVYISGLFFVFQPRHSCVRPSPVRRVPG